MDEIKDLRYNFFFLWLKLTLCFYGVQKKLLEMECFFSIEYVWLKSTTYICETLYSLRYTLMSLKCTQSHKATLAWTS